jgi:23S rRNA (cytosine1962-C5)-methyltransferase
LHAEGDDVSGLVVDVYAGVASVSLYSLGWHRRYTEVERVLIEEAGVERVVPRVDRRTAQMEGFDWPHAAGGTPVDVVEHGVRFRMDPGGGHKTGFFLDQRENRRLVAGLARGRTVFDGMTYTGGFALAAARGGAASVRGMDLDEEAVDHARRNAALNDVQVAFEHGDVFDALRTLAAASPAERPDLLVLDPPKWARDRAGLPGALQRYGDLNRLALDAVRPGGLLCTCTCSGLVSEEDFLDVLRRAALDARRAVRFLHVGGAAPDHPVAANFPEGRYLSCVLATVGPPGSGPGSQRGRSPAGPPGLRARP